MLDALITRNTQMEGFAEAVASMSAALCVQTDKISALVAAESGPVEAMLRTARDLGFNPQVKNAAKALFARSSEMDLVMEASRIARESLAGLGLAEQLAMGARRKVEETFPSSSAIAEALLAGHDGAAESLRARQVAESILGDRRTGDAILGQRSSVSPGHARALLERDAELMLRMRPPVATLVAEAHDRRQVRNVNLSFSGKWTLLEQELVRDRCSQNATAFLKCDCNPCEARVFKTEILLEGGDRLLSISFICDCGLIQEYERWPELLDAAHGLRPIDGGLERA